MLQPRRTSRVWARSFLGLVPGTTGRTNVNALSLLLVTGLAKGNVIKFYLQLLTDFGAEFSLGKGMTTMDHTDPNTIRSLAERGDPSCISDLLTALQKAAATIPLPAAVLPYGEPHPSVPLAEAIRGAIVTILTRCGGSCSEAQLKACAALPDIHYTLEVYYPPAALHDFFEHSI